MPINRLFSLLIECLIPSGPTTIHRQRPYRLGTHRLPLFKHLAWSSDHSSSDSRDRGCTCGHRRYYLLSHASRISADYAWSFSRLQVLPILYAARLPTHNLMTMLPRYNWVLSVGGALPQKTWPYFTHTGLPVTARECPAFRETESWSIVKTVLLPFFSTS